jgi:nucleoside-diphosphate-sugar epimerase
MAEVLARLASLLGSDKELEFDGLRHVGNPHSMVESLARPSNWPWIPDISLDDGLKEYVKWFLTEYSNA